MHSWWDDVTIYFLSRKIMVCLIWSCVFALLLCLKFAMWWFFPHRCQCSVFPSVLTKWTGFCFCCFCVSFFLMVPNVWMWLLCCFPVRIQNVNAWGNMSTRDELSRWHSFGLFLSEGKEPISWEFLCRAQLSLWTDNVLAKVRFFLRCFIDAVWTPH